MLVLVVATGCAFIISPTRTPQLAPRRDGALLPRAVPIAMARLDLPTVDGVDGPLVQTLATVCAKLYDHSLFTVFEPVDAPVNDKLEQPYKLVKAGGEYNEGGTYADGVYTNGPGALVSGYEIFNKDTSPEAHPRGSSSIASYGTVIDGFTDFHGEDQAAIPPFAALIVQPKDEPEADPPILILAWRGSVTAFDWINDAACSPTLSSRWSSETKHIRALGGYVNLVENTFSLHEDKIVKLITDHGVKRVFFTGQSLGGGIANVAHLCVRGQLKKAGSPWAELDGKGVTWLAYTFASPQTIVRKYEPEPPPSLMADLDDSSYNVVYGCDTVPRYPGMLKYLGDIVEIVAPEILTDIVDEKVEHAKYVGTLLKLFPFLNNRAKKKLDTAVDGPAEAAVEFLKEKGLAEVMGRYTHTGTVMYKETEDQAYVPLKGKAKIQEKLDVKNDAFAKLVTSKDKKASLVDAHMYFGHYEFGSTTP